MQELVNITYFLTKQGICKDMQKEILNYYDQDIYMDKLEIYVDEIYENIHEEYFKYIPNKTCEYYKKLIKHLFKVIQAFNNYRYPVELIINENTIDITINEQIQYPIETLAQYLKDNNLNHTTFPFYSFLACNDVSIFLTTIKLQTV